MKYVTPYNDLIDIPLFLARARRHLGLRQAFARSSASSIHLKRKTMDHYRKLFPSILLATGLSALLAAPAMADVDCPSMGHEMPRGGHAKRMEQHHKQLHDALKLTPEQEAGWKKLMDAEQHKPMREAAGQDWSKLSTPERAEKMLEFSKQRQAQMSERVTALKGFYATLTPEQQKTFDEFHAGPKGRMDGKPAPRGMPGEKAPAKP